MQEEQKTDMDEVSQSGTVTLQDYTSAVDRQDQDTSSIYKGKPLKLYLKFLADLAPYSKTGKDIEPYLEDIIKILIGAKRYFDLSTIFTFLRNHYDLGTETGNIYPLMKKVLSAHVNDLFTKSLTYSSSELNNMFADILGKDHALLMELVSYIFRKYSLFNAKLSENIYRKLIEISDSDIKSFIDHSDTRFLAFYLSTIPKLPYTPSHHISAWTILILSQSTNSKYTSKIIEAMKEHPSVDILLIFILAPRENERAEAMALLKDCVDMGMMESENYIKASAYFIEKALSGEFFDFHAIPGAQKEIFSLLIYMSGSSELKTLVVRMIREPNVHNDPKITETKRIFIVLLSKLFSKDPETIVTLTQMLKDDAIEKSIREIISKSVEKIKSKLKS